MPRLLRDFKRVRDDVALRKKEAKAIEFTIVKTSWNSFCKDPGKALTRTLETAMLEMDKTICEAYILANLHVSRMCEDRVAVPKLNQEFFYSCLFGRQQFRSPEESNHGPRSQGERRDVPYVETERPTKARQQTSFQRSSSEREPSDGDQRPEHGPDDALQSV